MLTLLELDADLQEVLDLIEANGGELTPELEAWLDESSANIERKLDGYVDAIDRFDERAAGRKAVAVRHAESAKVAANTAERLRKFVVWWMQLRKYKKYATQLNNFTLADNGGKQKLTTPLNAELLPEAFRVTRTTTVVEAKGDEIYAALWKASLLPPANEEGRTWTADELETRRIADELIAAGCKLAPRGVHLLIR
jgi:hypothetical protein